MQNKNEIKLVITDLDDTIWDWLYMWHSSFSVLLNRISSCFNINKDVLIDDFRSLHQKYHTTESSYIIRELKSLSPKEKDCVENRIQPKTNRTILHEYYSSKKNSLKMYDGAREFLDFLKAKNIKVVGFTESNSFFVKYRIKHLSLDSYFDRIYAIADYKLPNSVQKTYGDEYWESDEITFEYLPRDTKKPNPEILNQIINSYSINKSNVIYIGDKLDRDIAMANQAGVLSVYAKYGNEIDGGNYDLLRSVTHWTPEEVERERQFKHMEFSKPDYEVNNLMELAKLINFK